jgi:hypothetical protein
VKIHFKGSWDSAKKLSGYTRITSGDCDSGKIHWKMKTPPPS